MALRKIFAVSGKFPLKILTSIFTFPLHARSPTADEVCEMMPLTDDSFGDRIITSDKDYSVQIPVSEIQDSKRYINYLGLRGGPIT